VITITSKSFQRPLSLQNHQWWNEVACLCNREVSDLWGTGRRKWSDGICWGCVEAPPSAPDWRNNPSPFPHRRSSSHTTGSTWQKPLQSAVRHHYHYDKGLSHATINQSVSNARKSNFNVPIW